jgi:hypothetical protein
MVKPDCTDESLPKIDDSNSFKPRFRVYGDIAEFENERHLEWYFWNNILPELGLYPLKNQYNCGEGICDILAKDNENQLVIIELKNKTDSHVITQISFYFDTLRKKRPFSEQVDYTKPIKLYTVCPDYMEKTKIILKYHHLDIQLLSYTITRGGAKLIFTLFQWLTKQKLLTSEIPLIDQFISLNLPDPPKYFLDVLGQASEDERKIIMQARDEIYQSSKNLNYKINEKVAGRWITYEHNKQNPIVEIGWDNKRNSIAIYLWLPFTTFIGYINKNHTRADNYKRTVMMKLWLVGGIVEYLGYIEHARKSWIVVTESELQSGQFPLPTKLKKHRGNQRYWEGLAMPTEFYLGTINLACDSYSLSSFIRLAFQHALQKQEKSRKKKEIY